MVKKSDIDIRRNTDFRGTSRDIDINLEKGERYHGYKRIMI